MDVGTVVHRLKRGLYGSMRDLLLRKMGGVVGKDGDTRRDRAHTQRLPAVPSQVSAQPVVEAAKEQRAWTVTGWP
jgi:hypothetical protein